MDYKHTQFLARLLIGFFIYLGQAQASIDEQKLASDRQLFGEAVDYSSRGEWAKAESIYRDLLQRHLDWPEPRNNLAIVLMQTNRVDEARKMLEQAVATHPSFRISQNNRTRLYDYLASQAYDRALGVDDQRPLPELKLIESINLPMQVVEKTVEVVVEKPVTVEKIVMVEKPPSPAPAVVNVAHDGLNAQLKDLVIRWSEAWSNGDIETYLEAYSPLFETGDVRYDFNQWKESRRARLRISRNVEVRVENPSVFIGEQGKRAVVEFVQFYRSVTYRDKVLKQLVLQKTDDNWLITSERVIKTY